MRKALALGLPLLQTLLLASRAGATTYYVAPTGTYTMACTTRETACDITSGAGLAMAGDTVVLMDGIYKAGLIVPNSGTAEAPITFKADECATPIIEGPGVGPTEDNQDSGVFSSTGTYLKFIGIVSRGWSTGFGNGWTGTHGQDSNGNWDIEYCIADGNGRTGFTFFSAANFRLKNSISAHNGSSTEHSWSSGVTLYAALGGVVEGTISLENMDAENITDGSGFIVDEGSHGASFVNNVAFRNAGSCFRLTKSNGTKFINNTCYHNAQDTRDSFPDNPGEIYFTADSENSTTTNISFMNNVLVATGTGPGANAVNTTPGSGWDKNVVKTGSVNYFTKPDADLTLGAGASPDLVGKGTMAAGAPTTDIGFDPKCLSAGSPTLVGMIAKGSWWQYSVNIDYIKSIGGVAQCFHPKARSGAPDVGAYSNGAVMTTMPGTCIPPVVGPPPGMAGMGGASAGAGPAAGAGGMTAAGSGGVPAGGAPPIAGSGMVTAGAPASAGVPGVGGAPAAAGGSAGALVSSGGVPSNPSAGNGSTVSGAGGAGAKEGEAPAGCGCRVAGEPHGAALGALGLAGLALLRLRRRRNRR